jgi:hypothetical protein
LLIAAVVLLALGTVLSAVLVVAAVLWLRAPATTESQANTNDKPKEPSKDKPKEDKPKEDQKEPLKPDGPIVLIDEDFQTAAKKAQALPEGWIGDGFRVVPIKDRAALEVSKQGGIAEVVKVPLKQPVKGNFLISGDYNMGGYYKAIGVVLEDSKSGAVVPIVFHGTGGVSIVKDSYEPLKGFVPLRPAKFQIERTGNRLTAKIDGQPVASTNFKDIPNYDTLSISLTPGDTDLFKLKVENLGP